MAPPPRLFGPPVAGGPGAVPGQGRGAPPAGARPTPPETVAGMQVSQGGGFREKTMVLRVDPGDPRRDP